MKFGVTRNRVYNYICDYWDEHGYAPAFRDIADGLDLSLATITFHVNSLRKDGRIKYDPKISRSLVVLDK